MGLQLILTECSRNTFFLTAFIFSGLVVFYKLYIYVFTGVGDAGSLLLSGSPLVVMSGGCSARCMAASLVRCTGSRHTGFIRQGTGSAAVAHGPRVPGLQQL